MATRAAVHQLIAVFVTVSVILSSSSVAARDLPAPVGSDDTRPARVSVQARVLAADSTGLTVEVVAPRPVLVSVAGQAVPCQRFSWGEAREDAVSDGLGASSNDQPLESGWLIGIPAPRSASMSILDMDRQYLDVPELCGPDRGQLSYAVELDGRVVPVGRHGSQVAAAGAALDTPPLTLVDAGWLRHQPLARLGFQPVAAVGAGRYEVRTRVLARVTFDREAVRRAVRLADGAFGELQASALLNGRWAVGPAANVTRSAADLLPLPPLGERGGGIGGELADPMTIAGPAAGRRTPTPQPPPPLAQGRGSSEGPDLHLMRDVSGEESSGEDGGQVGWAGDGAAAGMIEQAGALRAADPLPADPRALQIAVGRDAPVAVRGADLAQAGWDLATVDPARVSLWAGGQPYALFVEGGEDGRLEPDDQLVFHGRAMTGEYTRQNVYWLTPDGEALRIAARDGTSTGQATAAESFTRTVHYEQDTIYRLSAELSEGSDRWMWGDLLSDGERRAVDLTLANLAARPVTATLRVTLQGVTDDESVENDHHARLMLNGKLATDFYFGGLGVHTVESELAPGSLVAGANAFELQNVGDTGVQSSQFYLNWIEIVHAAGYAATDDRLEFAAPAAGRYAFTLTGFTGAGVTVADVTDPARPVAINGLAVVWDEVGGGYSVSFEDAASEATRYVAYGPGGTSAPAAVRANSPSDWRSPGHGADYIIITHPLFADAIRPLAEYRAGQGLRVETVLIDDVYDEFSNGVFDPHAIRDFLRYAFESWAPPAPTYVLLVGEANLDYRRGYNQGPINYVPSMQIELTRGGAGSSDVWFASVHGDDPLPDMLLGRISASTPQQVATVVDKILTFEAGPRDAPWRRRAILVADDDSSVAFERLNESVARLAPPDHEIERFYAAGYPRDRDLTADIRAAIDEGALGLNFVGHGNVDTWGPWAGGGRIFQNDDISRLSNGDRLPLFTTATCMNGWVTHTLKPTAMAELWLTHPGGGGVAAWAPAGLKTFYGESLLLVPFYRGLYRGGQSIGALTVAAMASAYADSPRWADTFVEFFLLGDPALVVLEPQPRFVYLPFASTQPVR